MIIFAKYLFPEAKKSPWQDGYDTWTAGGVVPFPARDADYEERLRNAGWCAARRRHPNGAPQQEQEQQQEPAAGERIRGERG